MGTSPLKRGPTTGSQPSSLPWKGLVTIVKPVIQGEDKGQRQQGKNSLFLEEASGAGQGTRQRAFMLRALQACYHGGIWLVHPATALCVIKK